jgi:regulator of protease activity HflC (stomatin/prohibitin superfamily)
MLARKTKMFARILAVLAIPLFFGGCWPNVIDDGEMAAVKSRGRINPDELGPGFEMGFWFFKEIAVRSVRTQELTETLEVPTSGGMTVTIDATLLANRIPDQLAEQFINIQSNPWDTIVKPMFRSTIRDAISSLPIEEVYQEQGRVLIGVKTAELLRKSLKPYGFNVDAVLLRDVRLPEAFKTAVEAKLTEEQQVQQKVFALEKATKDAEIEVARARGAAEAQEIVRSTLSESYLQYLWIKTLNENPNVIYVATEANLPLFKNAK